MRFMEGEEGEVFLNFHRLAQAAGPGGAASGTFQFKWPVNIRCSI